MLKRLGQTAVLVAAVFLCGAALAAPSVCRLTGNLTDLYGNAAANARVTFDTTKIGVQNGSNSNQQIIVPSIQTVYVDSSGNLPTGAGCQPTSGASVCLIQGETVDITVGLHQPGGSYYSALPVRVQVPLMSTAGLTTLILAGTDPSSLLSQLNIGAGGDFTLSVVNPAVGNIGIATLTPGSVTGLNGTPLCATPPTSGQFLDYNGTQWCPASGFQNIVAPSGGPFSITGYVWNNLIDVRAYGCHGDLKPDTTITTTNGSTALAATDSPWSPADCHSGAGCTGAVDKAIRIENSGAGTNPPNAHYNTFNGKIVDFTDANHVTLSAAYGGTGEANDSAEWGTPDDACMTSIVQSGGTSTSGRVVNVYDSVPIIFTQPITFNQVTGSFVCNGMGAQEKDSTKQQGGFVWMGTSPDQYGITIQDSWGFRFSGCQVVGATSEPLMMGLRFYNSLTAPHPNAFNVIENTSVGGFGLIGIGIDDNGNGGIVNAPNANLSIGQTSITPTNTSAVVMNTLGPGQPIAIRDQVAGDELVYTSLSYTRGSVPIVLNQGLGVAHVAANTALIWAVAPVNNGIAWDWQGTQDDRNKLSNVAVRNAGTGILVGQGLVSAEINRINVNGAMVGIAANGGHVAVISPQWDGVCWVNYLSNNAKFTSLDPATQHGNQDSCGPDQLMGYTSPVVGLDYDTICGSTGLTGGGGGGCQALIKSGQVNLGANVAADGSVVDTGSGNGVNIDYEDVGIVNNQATNASAPAGVNPVIHTYGTATSQRRVKWSWWTTDRTRRLGVVDNGIADNRFIREYVLQQVPIQLGDPSVGEHRYLRGADTWSDAPNLWVTNGNNFTRGMEDVVALDAAQAPFSCTCATSGSQTWFYKIAWGLHDSAGNLDMGPVGSEASVASCANTVSSTNTVTCSTFPVRGADTLCYYRGSSSGTEALSACIPVGTSPDNAHLPTTFTDTTASPSGAPPTTDATGTLHIGTPASGMQAGDASFSRSATSGQVLLGSNGNQALDFGVTNSGLFTLSGAGMIIGQTTFSGLGTPVNGTIRYCSDCTIANPCAGSGSGAIAKRLNGIWVCN